MRFDILDASTNNQQSVSGLDSRFRLRVPDFAQESYAVLRHRGTKGNHQGFKDFADNLLTPSAFIFFLKSRPRFGVSAAEMISAAQMFQQKRYCTYNCFRIRRLTTSRAEWQRRHLPPMFEFCTAEATGIVLED